MAVLIKVNMISHDNFEYTYKNKLIAFLYSQLFICNENQLLKNM